MVIDALQRVAFDEAGHTGSNLLDEDQPVFVLASVLDCEEVRAIASESESELKFSTMRRSEPGRREILSILNHEALTPDRLVFSGFHKRFMIVTKIVDLLYEPMAHAGGHDLYEGGANIAFSNLLFATLPSFVGEDLFGDVLTNFVEMVRGPTDDSISAFFAAVERAYEAAPEDGLKAELGALYASRRILGVSPSDFHPSHLDPAIPAFIQHASVWTERLREPFDIVHDASKPIEHQQLVLEAMMSVSEEPRRIGYDRRKLSFPLAATGIELRDSTAEPGIQVADIIAGSAAYAAVRPAEDVFATRLLETRVLSGEWLPVWPSLDMSPEELGTDEPAPRGDPHLEIGDYVHRRLGGIPPEDQRRK